MSVLSGYALPLAVSCVLVFIRAGIGVGYARVRKNDLFGDVVLRGYCLHGRLNRIDHPVRLKKWPEVRTAWAFNYEAAARLTGYAKEKSVGGRAALSQR